MDPISPLAGLATPATLRECAASVMGRKEDRPETASVADSVEISELAGLLNRLADLPADRARRIGDIRQAIAAGTYDTPERFDVAVDRLLRDVTSQG
jgi:anti-sigma28 factor (negative regulator of flagellin synthesis)